MVWSDAIENAFPDLPFSRKNFNSCINFGQCFLLLVSSRYAILKLECMSFFFFFLSTTKDILPCYYKDKVNWPEVYVMSTIAQNFCLVSPFNTKSQFCQEPNSYIIPQSSCFFAVSKQMLNGLRFLTTKSAQISSRKFQFMEIIESFRFPFWS